MSWRLGLGVAVVAAVSIAVVVFAIMSTKGPGGAERIEAAIQWPANCGGVVIARPSRAVIVRRWAPPPVQTADIICPAARARVAYVHFSDNDSANRALVARQPSARYCQIGASVVIDELHASFESTAFADMCRNLNGTFVSNVR
jgi:hypothetical protein